MFKWRWKHLVATWQVITYNWELKHFQQDLVTHISAITPCVVLQNCAGGLHHHLRGYIRFFWRIVEDRLKTQFSSLFPFLFFFGILLFVTISRWGKIKLSRACVNSGREHSRQAKSLLSHVSLEACAAVTKAAPATTHTAQARSHTQSQQAIPPAAQIFVFASVCVRERAKKMTQIPAHTITVNTNQLTGTTTPFDQHSPSVLYFFGTTWPTSYCFRTIIFKRFHA